jgi:hypothetical protein
MPAAMRWVVLVVLALLAGCAAPPRFAEIAARLPPPDGHARLFVYRAYDLAQSLAWVPIFVNGAEIGGVGPGHVLLCDLPPGTYTIAARSQGLWPGQEKTVAARPGQQIYAEIGSFRSIDPTVSVGQVLTSTYVVMLKDTAAGSRDVAALWYAPCAAPYAPPLP